MGKWAWAALAAVALASCAGSKSAMREEPADVPVDAHPGEGTTQPPSEPPAADEPSSPPDEPSHPTAPEDKPRPSTAGNTFIDREHGFTIARPEQGWTFKPGEDLNTENIVVPLIVAEPSTGAQVVVQVAPAVASPTQFAERLTTGLQSRAGFSTSEVKPIPLADGAVGFDFEVGEQVFGRVAVLEGRGGRVYVLLATWPRNSPTSVEQDVDHILKSIKTAVPE